MITKLRRQFIATAMCSIVLVLAFIMTAIVGASYLNVCQNADNRVDMIAENGGHFNPKDILRQQTDQDDNPNPGRMQLSAESPYDTRYFTVTLSDSGTVSQIDTGRIAAIGTGDAADYAERLYQKNRQSGFVDCYRFQRISLESGSLMYIFLDCERELDTFRTFRTACIGVSVVGLLLVFLLVCLFSSILLRPVAESYAKQKRFITDASHELKTPLTIIDANTEVIEMTGGESQWTQSTRKQIARLTALTEKLVLLTRMDEEGEQTRMSDFPISDAILDTAEAFVPLAESKGRTLSIDAEPDLTCQGNEGMIRQLISLLLDNAIKYSPEGGQILLTFSRRGKNLCLVVKNTTEDIASGRHDEFFERFYRSDSSRNQKSGGYGIGLSVAQAIVTAHHGKISARSEDGRSLEITVLF
jgi:signal transduction histidine kinase